MVKRLPLSCENCRRRKIRCLGSGVPCDTCRKRGVASSCQFKRDVERNPSERHETSQEKLLQRISDLESLLIRNIELTSTSNTQHDHTLRSPVSQNDLLHQDNPPPTTVSACSDDQFSNNSIGPQRVEVGSIITSSSGHVRYVPYSNSHECDVFHSLQTRSQLETSSGVSLFTETMLSTQSLLDMLPPFRYCDELITVFLSVFSPLFHILHDGTFQSNYTKLKQDPRNTPASFIGLIFVSLGLAVTAIDKESPILADLGREASTAESVRSLAAKYRQAAMRCLVADNFMWQHNLHTLQCLILLIYAINHAEGPAWALLGTTVNIAIAIGCHIDPALLKLPSVEIQERRRAWAALMMLYTIQNTCLGNLAPFQVKNNVQLPADVEDEEIVPGSFHEVSHGSVWPPEPKNPTKMSYILYKFRLYSLASDICDISMKGPTTCPDKIHALDDQLQAEMQAQAERFCEQRDMPTYHQAHSFILNNYSNHLVLLLHRICLLRPEELDESFTTSPDKCEQAALAILSNYETLNLEPEFKPYSWYIHGIGSFHAFLAVSTLLVLMAKVRTSRNPKHLILQAVQSCLRRFHENAPYSEICSRTCSILDPLIPGELSRLTQLFSVSDTVGDMGSTAGLGSSSEPMTIDISDFPDISDPSFWALPESFEETVAKIPCEQWLSPAVFPWADRFSDGTSSSS
ncbi:hypothetical protein N7456_009082 [Penicillium angulare]|uniref:Zn(2)-C6 fungal-type domain-containing protein n=1 Tax=Penicillium angulare TaxID=116970 RepID=A0A9W9F4A4_9EURO|nr:hypothetical protein N7456_009082 [Penicillium angulare]